MAEDMEKPPPYTEVPPPYTPAQDPKAQLYPAHHMPPTYPTAVSPVVQGYGSTTIVQPVGGPATQVIVIGGCPACRIGILEDDFTLCGVLCAIFCFPIGLLFCFAMRQRRCPHCGAIFG